MLRLTAPLPAVTQDLQAQQAEGAVNTSKQQGKNQQKQSGKSI